MSVLKRSVLMICLGLVPAALFGQSGSSRTGRIPTLDPSQVEMEGLEQSDQCKDQIAFWQTKADNTELRNQAIVRETDQLRQNYEELRRQKVFGTYTAAITIAILAIGIGIGIRLL